MSYFGLDFLNTNQIWQHLIKKVDIFKIYLHKKLKNKILFISIKNIGYYWHFVYSYFSTHKMCRVICCDFEFMHVDAETRQLIVLKEKSSEQSPKKTPEQSPPKPKRKVICIAFVMTTGQVDAEDTSVQVGRFLSGLHTRSGFTDEVCERMTRNLHEYREKVIGEDDIVVVWDKSGDEKFIHERNTVLDLRDVFRQLGLLRLPQFCSSSSTETGLKAVASRFLSDYIEVNCKCQIGNWNIPTDEMMEYATNDVVLLQKLIEFAKKKFRCQTFHELWKIARENEEIKQENLEWFKLTRDAAIAEATEITKERKDLTGQERHTMLIWHVQEITAKFKNVDMEQIHVARTACFPVYTVGQNQHRLVMYDFEKDYPCEMLFASQMMTIGVNPENIKMKQRLDSFVSKKECERRSRRHTGNIQETCKMANSSNTVQ